MPPSFGHHFQGILIRILPLVPYAVTPTGLSPSSACRSRHFGFPRERLEGVLQLHIPSDFHHQVRFALCPFHSPLLRASRLLSSPPGTKMFPFPGFPFAAANDASYLAPGSPIRQSRVQGLHAPRPGFSQLATAFLGARAEPSPKWLRRVRSFLNPASARADLCMAFILQNAILPYAREARFTCCNMWTRRDSNPGPSACKADALPLSYGPSEGPVPQIAS